MAEEVEGAERDEEAEGTCGATLLWGLFACHLDAKKPVKFFLDYA